MKRQIFITTTIGCLTILAATACAHKQKTVPVQPLPVAQPVAAPKQEPSRTAPAPAPASNYRRQAYLK